MFLFVSVQEFFLTIGVWAINVNDQWDRVWQEEQLCLPSMFMAVRNPDGSLGGSSHSGDRLFVMCWEQRFKYVTSLKYAEVWLADVEGRDGDDHMIDET